MSKPTVCLTFDFDAISVFAGSFGLTTPTYVSRGEFAANVATPRILDMLRRENVLATWFIPGMDIDTYPAVCKQIRDSGHEIGHHGYAHEAPMALAEEDERRTLEQGLDALDRVLQVRPYGYRSPAWDLSPNSTRLRLRLRLQHDGSRFRTLPVSNRGCDPYRSCSGVRRRTRSCRGARLVDSR